MRPRDAVRQARSALHRLAHPATSLPPEPGAPIPLPAIRLRPGRPRLAMLVHVLVLVLALGALLVDRAGGAELARLPWQAEPPLAAAAPPAELEIRAPPVPPVAIASVNRREVPAAMADRSGPAAIPVFVTSHTLREGETLGSVAARYGLPLASLVWANTIVSDGMVAVGQTLRVPRLAGVPHVIAEDETVASIAAQYGVQEWAVLGFAPNGLRAGLPLPVGREIFVPGGVAPFPQAFLDTVGGTEGLAALTPQLAGIVRDYETNVRTGPGRAYPRIVQLDAGRMLGLVARHADWARVRAGGLEGWVRNDLLILPPGAFEALPETNDFPPPPPLWVWPTRGQLTSGFGPRWGGFHDGIDIANRAWTPIGAARAGTVIEAGWCSGYGYCVRLRHGDGVVTEYGHMIDDPVVTEGQEVAAGDLIGYMGSTYDRAGGGYSTGVHLHFTIKINGQAVNPLRYLP